MTDVAANAETPTASSTNTRGSPRPFWVGMAVFLIVMVFLGFGSTYGRQLATGAEISGFGLVETDWVIHLHAAVFLSWMAFLLVQTILQARGRTHVHVVVGRYVSLPLGVAILSTGGLIAYMQMRAGVSKGLFPWSKAPLLANEGWTSLLAFTGLLGLGLLYRRRPAVHKRLMMFATIALAIAATARMDYLLGAWRRPIGLGIMVAPILAYDLYAEGQVRPVTLIGTAVVGMPFALDYPLSQLSKF